MSENNEQVEKLLGDFFERHTAGDKEGMNEVTPEDTAYAVFRRN